MDTIYYRVGYRPIRIGWCVNAGSLKEVMQVMHWNHCLWGGPYNPIIPVDDAAFAAQLAELFHVDLLISADHDNSDTEFFVKSQPHLLLPHISGKERISFDNPMFLDLQHALSLFQKEVHQPKNIWPLSLTLADFSPDDPLAPIFLATFGALPFGEEGAKFKRAAEQSVQVNVIKIEITDCVPSQLLSAKTLNDVAEYRAWVFPAANTFNNGLYVGESDNFDDIVAFWNLRATGRDLYFYDHRYRERLFSIIENYIEKLDSEYKDGETWLKCPALLGRTRPSLTTDELPVKGWDYSAVTREFWFDRYNGPEIATLDEVDQIGIISGKTADTKLGISVAFPSRLPLKSSYWFGCPHYITTLKAATDFPIESPFSASYPFLPRLNDYFSKQFSEGVFGVRVEQENVALIRQKDQDVITINPVEKDELLARVFELAGLSALLSAPGSMAKQVISQMGTLDNCKIFRIPGVRKLLSEYDPDKSLSRDEARDVILDKDDNGRPRFVDFEEMGFGFSKRSDTITAYDVLDFLVDRGILRVGLEFRCSFCNLKSWMHLDHVKMLSTCQYCGGSCSTGNQVFERDTWRYRRSGLFGEKRKQLGVLPCVLTLRQLQPLYSGRPFSMFSTAVDICKVGSTERLGEADFVILNQEHRYKEVEVILGECKTGLPGQSAQIDRLVSVAHRFEKAGMRPILIFATLNRHSEEELDAFKKIRKSEGLQVILLSCDDLQAASVFPSRNKPLTCSEDVVRATDNKYFNS